MGPPSVLITNGNLFSMVALGDWLLEHGRHVRKVYVTHRLPSSKGNVRGVLSLLVRSGWAYTYLKIWANKVFPLGLRRRGLPASVADFVRLCGHDVAVEPVDSVNTAAVVDEIRALAPDYLLSFSSTQRFKEPLIESPSRGAINVHYGALPAYAGLSPYYWHLHNQEETYGVTLHQIVPQLDAGPIIEQQVGRTEGAKTCLELLLRMASHVSPMLLRFFAGETTLEDALPQDPTGRSYFRHPTRTQVRQFHRNGFRMMDAASRRAARERVTTLAERARTLEGGPASARQAEQAGGSDHAPGDD